MAYLVFFLELGVVTINLVIFEVMYPDPVGSRNCDQVGTGSKTRPKIRRWLDIRFVIKCHLMLKSLQSYIVHLKFGYR
jgi:hypothetical protein